LSLRHLGGDNIETSTSHESDAEDEGSG